MQIGTVSESGSAGRSGIHPKYKQCLYDSKIVLHANPDSWEGDARTWEALASGALVFVDRIIDESGVSKKTFYRHFPSKVDLVLAFLETRGYLARGVPLLKHIAALPAQVVCRTGRTITVNGVTMGHVLDRDHLGRILPVWEGCRLVANQEVFLMNWQSENSLDGRYFGPLPVSTIVGRADPLWMEQDH